MTITLYYTAISPPARAVHLALIALNIPFNLHNVNIYQGDQRKSDFERKNPQHTMPTLQDGNFYVWDNHVINAYLVNKYADNDDLYAKDSQKRAIIDLRLNFDTGVLFPCIRNITKAIRTNTFRTITPESTQNYQEAYNFVEKFFKYNEYAAGNSSTIADFSFVTSLVAMNTLLSIDENKFPSIVKYLNLCKSTIPRYI